MFATVGIQPTDPPIIDSHYFHAIPLTAWVPFWSCDSKQLLQPHANLSPKRGDTSRPIFAQQRARDTKDQILHPPCLHPRSYRPLQWHNSPVAQMCRPPGVRSHGTCVSCFVRRASAFAAVQVPLLLLRVPVGCRRREAGSRCGRRSSSQKTHSHDQHPQIITIPLSPNKPS